MTTYFFGIKNQNFKGQVVLHLGSKEAIIDRIKRNLVKLNFILLLICSTLL